MRKVNTCRSSTHSLTGPGSGANSPLSPDSECSGSDKASACSVSIRSISTSNFSIPEHASAPSISPSKEKHPISTLWSKVVRPNARPPPRRKSQDLLALAELAVSTNPRPLSLNNYDYNHLFPDFVGDPSVEDVAIAL